MRKMQQQLQQQTNRRSLEPTLGRMASAPTSIARRAAAAAVVVAEAQADTRQADPTIPGGTIQMRGTALVLGVVSGGAVVRRPVYQNTNQRVETAELGRSTRNFSTIGDAASFSMCHAQMPR